MMWTDDALHRLERMPPYLAPLFQDEIEQDLRARGERVVDLRRSAAAANQCAD